MRGLRLPLGVLFRQQLQQIFPQRLFHKQRLRVLGQDADGAVHGDNSTTGERVELRGTDLCSMNMWGFTPDYFAKSAAIFETFLEQNGRELKKEYYIPYAIDCMIRGGSAKCDVLSTPSRWFGVTYKEDRPAVVEKFAQLAREGVYPTPLYQ